MRVGVDTYSFHRFLGEVYPHQSTPPPMDYLSVVERVLEMGVDGVFIETCFLEEDERRQLRTIRSLVRNSGVEALLAWGHPFGLHGGDSDEAQRDLESAIGLCEQLGSRSMRIVGSNRRLMTTAKQTQLQRLAERLRVSIRIAESAGVRLAIENHLDFSTRDLLQLIDMVESDYLGITFDTGNALRMGEDPVEAAATAGKHVFMTHMKDVFPIYGGNPVNWSFFAAVPCGTGIINLPGVVKSLTDAGYRGFYAVEVDDLHPKNSDEFDAVINSVAYLKSL